MKLYNIENLPLAFAIKRELINQRLRTLYDDSNEFTQKELAAILKISIYNASSLDGMQYLRNLEILNIYNNSNDFDNNQINRITDFSLISTMRSLKKIYILNDMYIKTIDIAQLSALKELVLVSNPNLNQIIGLEQATNLQKVIIVGNSYDCQVDLNEYLSTNHLKARILLDILMFDNIFMSNPTIMPLAKAEGVLFAEKIGFGETFVLNLSQMRDMYNKYNKILRTLVDFSMSDYEKVKKVYNFVVSNLTYDYEGLAERKKYFNKNLYQPFLDNKRIRNFRKMNSSYGALYKKRVVCEGYINMMRFFLSMLKIKSRTVFSCIKVNNNCDFDHTIIALQIGNEWLYTDPEKFGLSEENFLKNKEEIEKDYLLSPSEKILYDLSIKNNNRSKIYESNI